MCDSSSLNDAELTTAKLRYCYLLPSFTEYIVPLRHILCILNMDPVLNSLSKEKNGKKNKFYELLGYKSVPKILIWWIQNYI